MCFDANFIFHTSTHQFSFQNLTDTVNGLGCAHDDHVKHNMLELVYCAWPCYMSEKA